MPFATQTCLTCGEEFTPLPNHRGKINVCLACGNADVDRYVAKVAFTSKNASSAEIEITKDAASAAKFNKRTLTRFSG